MKSNKGCIDHIGYWSNCCGMCEANKLEQFNSNLDLFWKLFGPDPSIDPDQGNSPFDNITDAEADYMGDGR